MHGIAYDEIHDELIVPQQFSQAILIFRGGANGEEPPIRKIQGPRTRLRRPDRLAVDPVHHEIFVVDGSAVVLVFAGDGDGDVAPIRTLGGPDTRLGQAGGSGARIAVDPVNDALILLTTGGELLIFNRTAEGNAEPRAVISGPKTGLRRGRVAVYPPRGWVLVVSGSNEEEDSFFGVWSIHDNGDVPPRWRFTEDRLEDIRGLTLDPKNKSIIVTDKQLNAVLTYYLPEIF